MFPRATPAITGPARGNFGKFRYGKRGHLSPDDLTRIEKSVMTALGM